MSIKDKIWGRLKEPVMNIAKDPVKVGILGFNAVVSGLISYKIEKLLYKPPKYNWLGWKTTKIPILNAEVPYPGVVSKNLWAPIKGKPATEFKRNLIAGVAGSAVSLLWTIPLYKADKELGKVAAIGTGINLAFWCIRGAIQAGIAYTKGVTEDLFKTDEKKAKSKSKLAPLPAWAPLVSPALALPTMLRMPMPKAPAMPKLPGFKMPAAPKIPGFKMPKVKLWGAFVEEPVADDDEPEPPYDPQAEQFNEDMPYLDIPIGETYMGGTYYADIPTSAYSDRPLSDGTQWEEDWCWA
jgi:hypothetical protein